MLYDDVRKVPTGAILGYDEEGKTIEKEAIVRKAKIKSITYKIQEPIAKPVIGRFQFETVKTYCTITLEIEGMPALENNSGDGVNTFNDTVNEFGVNGDTENVVIQGVSICHDKEKYIEQFEKEDAFADALNRIQQLKIELVGDVENGTAKDEIPNDSEGKVIFTKYPEPKANSTKNIPPTPETPVDPEL